MFNRTAPEPLGDFGDKLKYRGLVPSGKYLEHVYKKLHESIRSHLSKEVKKRGATRLHWDVSYKEAKHLCQYRGRLVFKGLVTALNELGEVRMQFHVYTDSQEQMTSALEAFKRTTANLGLPGVKLFTTDNPVGDQRYFLDMLPSLDEQQKKFDAMSNEDKPNVSTKKSPSVYDYSSIKVKVVETRQVEYDGVCWWQCCGGDGGGGVALLM